MEVTLFAAFVAGVVSFFSPCVLPLVPGYISLMTGVSAQEVKSGGGPKTRIVVGVGLFVLGFTAVFVSLQASASLISRYLIANQVVVRRIAAALIIAMAVLLILGAFGKAGFFLRDRRFEPDLSGMGMWAAPVMGAAFAFAWTPCIGPVLGAVLATAQVQETMGRGIVLLLAYSLGLGVPFMAAGVAMGKMVGLTEWFKRHNRPLMLVAGVSLGLFGTLLLFDQISIVATWMLNNGIGWGGSAGI